MLVVRLLLNSRLLVVKFGGSQEIHTGFQQHTGRCPQPARCSRVNCSHFVFVAHITYLRYCVWLPAPNGIFLIHL